MFELFFSGKLQIFNEFKGAKVHSEAHKYLEISIENQFPFSPMLLHFEYFNF